MFTPLSIIFFSSFLLHGLRHASRSHTKLHLRLYELPSHAHPPNDTQSNDTSVKNQDLGVSTPYDYSSATGYFMEQRRSSDGYDMRHGPYAVLGEPPEDAVTLERLQKLQDIARLVDILHDQHATTHTKLAHLRNKRHMFSDTDLQKIGLNMKGRDAHAPDIFAGGLLGDWETKFPV